MDERSQNLPDQAVTSLTGRIKKIQDLLVLVFSIISSVVTFFSTRSWHQIGAGILAVIIIGAAFSWIYYRHRKTKHRKLITGSEDTAFKGLLSFEENDAQRFYGRGIDIGELVQRVRHSDFRFGVLTGGSGCGKTSLIKAGLIPRLRQEGYFPVYVRLYLDPLVMIRQAVNRAVREEAGQEPDLGCNDSEDLHAYLRRVTKSMGKSLVLCCDQFEEFFIRFPTENSRAAFIQSVSHCVDDLDLPVKFLFALREDFLVRIEAFDGHIPNPLDIHKRYHLKNLDTDQAAEIIQRSVDQAQVPFEPALCKTVAVDLAVKERVLPTELQIVCQQMQFHHLFTAAKYRQSGGKESLVFGFLEEVIKGSGTEREVKMVLRGMISEENTRLTLTLDEISHRSQKNRDRVKAILDSFVRARLIREIQDEEPWRYEFMHEYLIGKINAISGSVMDANKRANLAFRQWLIKYDLDKKTRIPLGEWRFISRYSDLKRNAKDKELLAISLRSGLFKYGSIGVFGLALLSVAGIYGIQQQKRFQSSACDIGKLTVDNPHRAQLTLKRVKVYKSETCSGFDETVLKENEINLEGPGDYMLTAEINSRTVKYPVYVEGYEHTVQVTVTPLPEDEDISEGMVYIPPGEFRMGDKDKSDGIDSNAIPYNVRLDGFFLDKTEVTNEAYARFMEAGGYDDQDLWSKEGIKFVADLESKQPRLWQDENFNDQNQPDHRPVVGVSWYEARAYCQWRGKKFRLPTEAEWEKAARGPEGFAWSFGNTLDNKNERANSSGDEDGYEYTAPVASYAPNGYGLNDMSGNVWEWVQDTYDEGFYQAEGTAENPVNKGSGDARIIRGGSWYNDPEYLRASIRDRNDPRNWLRNDNVGFRCARTL